MRTLTPTVAFSGILATLTVTCATAFAKPGGVVVWSHHGKTESPTEGAAIKPGDAFPFSYRQANMCQDDAVKVSSYLSRAPPAQTAVLPSGQLAPGSFAHHFGDWTVSNWGLPSKNPPPATLVMPVLEGTPRGTPMWFTVVENYADCPDHFAPIAPLAFTMSSTPSQVQKHERDGDCSSPSNHPTGALADLTRDTDFWFEDGNVVLVARNTGFKVYKGLLASQSPIFQDLFASASHAEETYEGCPVVRLCDTPEGLRCLLPYLLPSTYVSVVGSIPTTVNMDLENEYKRLSTLILLADKYQLESIAHQAIECLKTAFPINFDQWDARPEADGLHARAGCEPSTSHRLHAIDAVHLARITHTTSVLPLALYHCALLGDKAAEGWTREDGTVQQLAAGDLERTLGGYKHLCEKRAGFLAGLFNAAPSAGCRTPIMCGELLQILWEKGERVYETPALLHRPSGWTFRLPLCQPCNGELEQREKAQRHELWKELPDIFRVSEKVKVWEE
uniref:Zn(2)-C6 fungal-type domain-containing protein n=1 Tax=Ganoderma boninense TaxID=34458 RepID=A0A5K1JZA2_9APHY|nr:Zn(2)-C6 fungal-type domain-containing protein [Ganoderma boninense]